MQNPWEMASDWFSYRYGSRVWYRKDGAGPPLIGVIRAADGDWFRVELEGFYSRPVCTAEEIRPRFWATEKELRDGAKTREARTAKEGT
jgi:hypothetical protein